MPNNPCVYSKQSDAFTLWSVTMLKKSQVIPCLERMHAEKSLECMNAGKSP